MKMILSTSFLKIIENSLILMEKRKAALLFLVCEENRKGRMRRIKLRVALRCERYKSGYEVKTLHASSGGTGRGGTI